MSTFNSPANAASLHVSAPRSKRIVTPLPLAYSFDIRHQFQKLPHLSEYFKDAIFGICIGNLIICKDQFPDYWSNARIIAENCSFGKMRAALPSFEELAMLHREHLDAFNETVRILQDNQVDADLFSEKSDYWTGEETSDGYAVAYSPVHQREQILRGDMQKCFCRPVWHC